MQIRLSRRAQRYLERLDRPGQERIARALDRLASDPFHPDSKPLHGLAGDRVVRVGGLRIVYYVRADDSIVEVERIAPRGEVYRGLS